jgi:hypothetical protein
MNVYGRTKHIGGSRVESFWLDMPLVAKDCAWQAQSK